MFNSKKFLSCTAAVLALSMSVSGVAFADEAAAEEEPAVTTVTETAEVTEAAETENKDTDCKEHKNGPSFFDPMAIQNSFMNQCKHFVKEAADKEGISVEELLAQKKDEADARRLEVLTQQAEEQGITVDELIANIQAQKEAQREECKQHQCTRPERPVKDEPVVSEEAPVTTTASEEDTDPEFTVTETTSGKHQRPAVTKPAVTEPSEPAVTEITSSDIAQEETPDTTEQTKAERTHARKDQNKGSHRNSR
ncbi:MAG: hypothetical protein Q4F95_01370 [Oscillospiraceae bacterium]|nr:hypothetical protein [Oscillospiraceae bacterium]